MTLDKNSGSFNPLETGSSKMDTFGNSADPYEILHHATFHKGLHCLLIQTQY